MSNEKVETIVLGGGCSWCLDAPYRQIRGVLKSDVGYSGGNEPNPTYQAVCSGMTGHIEVVKLTFDPVIINLANILDIFWILHDPTSKDAQGADVGSQYASVIFYSDDSQLPIIEESKSKIQKLWSRPVVTETRPLKKFYLAEAEHQDYFNKNPAAGYCQVVINPKLMKLRQEFAKLLK